MVPWVLLFAGCLERVTGEAVPLDPRFYEGKQDGEGQPSADPNAGGTGDGPYVGYDGDTWLLVGVVKGADPGAVQIDVNEPDEDAPGGVTRAGALHLVEPGPFEVKVPKTVTSLQLQAFQDPSVNGPDESDPFAEALVDLTDGPPEELVLELVAGARGKAGAPGGQGGGGQPGSGAPGSAGGDPSAPPPPQDGLSFPPGDRVVLSGSVTVERDLPVVLDFFHSNGEGAGGRAYLGKKMLPAAGEWSQEFPVNYGGVEVEAYQDLTGDSRTGDDPAARLSAPVVMGEDDVAGIVLAIP